MPIKIYKPIGMTPVELIINYKKKNQIKEKVSFWKIRSYGSW